MQKTFIIAVLLSAVFLLFPAQSSAYTQVLTSVKMNPEVVPPLEVGHSFHFSTLGFDQYGFAIWTGVTYEWGISSDQSIGQVIANADGKTAGIKTTGSGQGDIYVIARQGQQVVTTSTRITVNPDTGACAADINQDHTVNIKDYTILAKYFMQQRENIPTPRADIDGNGKVNLIDYSILAREFMKTCP